MRNLVVEKRLETSRLLLRRSRLSDGEAFLRIRNSPYVLRYNPMDPITLEKALEQLAEDRDSSRVFYLEERATKKLVGVVYLAEDSLRYGVSSVTLEYFLGEEFAGRGLMTEALGALLEYAFFVVGAEVVSARVFLDNKGSQRVLEKLGFTRNGVLRQAVKGREGTVYDDVAFSLLKEEFLQRREESQS